MKRIVIVYKESTYSRYFKGKEAVGEVRLLKKLHDQHFCMVERAILFLRKEGIEVIPIKRAQLKPIHHADLVVTIGGDGTFLDTAHCVEDSPIFGINSNPGHSEGIFMVATPKTFHARWREFAQGKLTILKLHRLQIRINGRVLPERVLNDVLIGHTNPAAVSRYEIRVGRKKEEQKSSGLWIAAAAGSTAAIRSAGGKVLPIESHQIQYRARELFHGRHNRYRLTKGIVGPNTKIQITSKMQKAACYLDGPRVWYSIYYGDRVEIQSASQFLRVVGPIR